ncbi:MAG: mannose-6-phosphate isomerase, partial [Bacteroidales bacterium]|nr:mannose-6-phosphate isomerase [Bacteroidales bacterium]
MNTLYPLCFIPVPVARIWGGGYFARHIHTSFPSDLNIGESWELCGLQGSNSVVSNGFLSGNEINELIEVYMEDLVGESVFQKFSNEFPLSVKLLDINDYL